MFWFKPYIKQNMVLPMRLCKKERYLQGTMTYMLHVVNTCLWTLKISFGKRCMTRLWRGLHPYFCVSRRILPWITKNSPIGSQRFEEGISGLIAKKKHVGVTKSTSIAFDAAISFIMPSSTIYILVRLRYYIFK